MFITKFNKILFESGYKIIGFKETEECLVPEAFENRTNEYPKYKGKLITRTLYEIINKTTLRGDQFCCHTCDHPNCINPGHIFIGSNNDNTQDMIKKGRAWNPIEDGPRIKESDYSEIIRLYECSKQYGFPTMNQIARHFNVVTKETITRAYKKAMGFDRLEKKYELGFGWE